VALFFANSTRRLDKQEECAVVRGKTWLGILLAALGLTMAYASPVMAQFSDAYRFLEAVRKKDGVRVTELLNQPGSTVITSRDITTGETALHIVTQRRDSVWIRFLIERGANPNARDRRGVTPLVLASRLGYIEGIQALIDAGARVDEANDAGETPLISAVHRRDVEMIRVLLKAGADPDRADNSGRSARDYAQLEGGGLVGEIERNTTPRAESAGDIYGPTF